MAHYKCFKRIVFIALFIAFLVVVLRRRTSYDWDTKVKDYISTFNCELMCLGIYKDDLSSTTVYKFQTNDVLQIEFELHCFWGDTLLPVGFEIPIKKANIVDNFAEQLCIYISETEGTYNIEDKTIEEISTYVLETLQHCEVLLKKYGVEDVIPNISFTLVKVDETYTFKYGNFNENILYDKLTKLLYE